MGSEGFQEPEHRLLRQFPRADLSALKRKGFFYRSGNFFYWLKIKITGGLFEISSKIVFWIQMVFMI